MTKDKDQDKVDEEYREYWESYWEVEEGSVNKMQKYFDALEKGKSYYNAGGNACNTLWIENDSVMYSFLLGTEYKGYYSLF